MILSKYSWRNLLNHGKLKSWDIFFVFRNGLLEIEIVFVSPLLNLLYFFNLLFLSDLHSSYQLFMLFDFFLIHLFYSIKVIFYVCKFHRSFYGIKFWEFWIRDIWLDLFFGKISLSDSVRYWLKLTFNQLSINLTQFLH